MSMVGRTNDVTFNAVFGVFIVGIQFTYYGVAEDRHGVGNLSDSTLETLQYRFPHTTKDQKEEAAPGLGPLFPTNFDKWNKLRQADGFLCRNNDDCEWMSDTKIKGGFVGLYCEEEDVNESVREKWFGRPSVSVGSCRCKHFLFPQYYDKEEVRCYMSIIIVIGIVLFPLTLILLGICFKIISRGKSKVDVTFPLDTHTIENSNQ